jgi:hypothetical protein
MRLSKRLHRATFILKWTAPLLCLVSVVGCKREEIRVYTAPKELPPPTSGQASSPRVRPHVHYKVPEGWNELPADGMRLARLSVPAKSGDLDVSVISLPGIAASQLDIVNLWREQVQLPPATETELASMSEKVRVGDKEGDLFEMVSAEPLINEKDKARILVAMVKDGSTSWFMKMTGEDTAVREQKPKFIEFLSSLTFDYGSHDEEPPQTTSVPSQNTNSGGKPGWQVPANWKEVPPTEMLLAKFVVPGKGEEKAEVTVSVFPGDVGGLHLNINRWRRQIGLPEADEKTTKELARPLEGVSRDAVLVDMSGATTRVIGAIVPEGGRTWFYKLTGSPSVAEAEKDSLVKFVQSAKQKQNGG